MRVCILLLQFSPSISPFLFKKSLQSFRMIGENSWMRLIWRNRTPITPEKSPLKGGLWQPSFFKAIKQRQFRACKGIENAGQVVLRLRLACSCLFFTLLGHGGLLDLNFTATKALQGLEGCVVEMVGGIITSSPFLLYHVFFDLPS